MTEQKRRRSAVRVAVTSLLVASGVGVVGVVPALAAGPVPAAHHSDRSGDDGDRHRGHDRWFRDRGDVRYVWFRVCDTDAAVPGTTPEPTTTAPATTTVDPVTGPAATDTVAPDALTAAVEGAAVETAPTTTDTTTTEPTTTGPTTTGPTTTEPAPTTTVDEDDPDAEAYPTFIAVPLPKDEAKAFRKMDDRPCYDLTTGAPATDPATTTTAPVTPAPVNPAPVNPAPATPTTDPAVGGPAPVTGTTAPVGTTG